MTICIAALCDQSKACVVCADREMTAPGLSLEFEHGESKIDKVSDHCVIMSSGDALLAAEVIGRMASIPAGSSPTVRQVAEALRDSYMTVHMERAEHVLLRPRGLTLAEFRQTGSQLVPLQVYLNIDQSLFNFGIGAVDFLVAGVDTAGSHVFRVHYNGVAGGSWLEWGDKIGSRAIGSGSPHASMFLSLEGQHRGISVAETIFNVFCAKTSAELAPGVGRATDLAVITADGIEPIPEEKLKVLAKLKQNSQKAKVVLDDLQDVYAQFQPGAGDADADSRK